MFSLFRNSNTPKKRRTASVRRSAIQRNRRTLLSLETLEDRCVPALLLEYSVDGGAHFSNPVSDNGSGSILVQIGTMTIFATTSGTVSVPFTSMDLGVTGTPSSSINLVVRATLTDINTAPPPQTMQWSFQNSSLNSTPVTMETWVDNNNTPFGTTGTPGVNIVADTGNTSVPSGGNIPGSQTFSATACRELPVQEFVARLARELFGSGSQPDDLTLFALETY